MVQRVLYALQQCAPNTHKFGENVQDRKNFSSCTCRQRNRGQGVENADRSAALVTPHVNPLMLTISRKRPTERRKYAINALEKLYSAVAFCCFEKTGILYELFYVIVSD